jgi:hypothetical protein
VATAATDSAALIYLILKERRKPRLEGRTGALYCFARVRLCCQRRKSWKSASRSPGVLTPVRPD